MSRARKRLLPGEVIAYATKVHWNVLIIPALLVLVVALPAVYGYFALAFKLKIALLFIALAPCVLFLIGVVKRNATEFAVTNQRVIIDLGVLSSTSFEILLSKIESITIHQTLIGKLLNFGLLEVGGTGGTKEKFSNIQNPMEFRRQVQEQMAKSGRG
jgi:uncharacterized membrane protein YdbT with pleckstrin-like domain